MVRDKPQKHKQKEEKTMNLMERMFQISMAIDVFERSKEITFTKKLSKTEFLKLCWDIIKKHPNYLTFEEHVEQYLLSYETYHKTGDV